MNKTHKPFPILRHYRTFADGLCQCPATDDLVSVATSTETIMTVRLGSSRDNGDQFRRGPEPTNLTLETFSRIIPEA